MFGSIYFNMFYILANLIHLEGVKKSVHFLTISMVTRNSHIDDDAFSCFPVITSGLLLLRAVFVVKVAVVILVLKSFNLICKVQIFEEITLHLKKNYQ